MQFRSLFSRRKREKHNITRNGVSNREVQSVRPLLGEFRVSGSVFLVHVFFRFMTFKG